MEQHITKSDVNLSRSHKNENYVPQKFVGNNLNLCTCLKFYAMGQSIATQINATAKNILDYCLTTGFYNLKNQPFMREQGTTNATWEKTSSATFRALLISQPRQCCQNNKSVQVSVNKSDDF